MICIIRYQKCKLTRYRYVAGHLSSLATPCVFLESNKNAIYELKLFPQLNPVKYFKLYIIYFFFIINAHFYKISVVLLCLFVLIFYYADLISTNYKDPRLKQRFYQRLIIAFSLSELLDRNCTTSSFLLSCRNIVLSIKLSSALQYQ